MELAYQYIYKIVYPILPIELGRIIIKYLIQEKFNKLQNKVQNMYNNRKYYIISYDKKDEQIFKEVSLNDILHNNFSLYNNVYDEISANGDLHAYYCTNLYCASTSFRGIIMKIYKNIYDNIQINNSIKMHYGNWDSQLISRKELLKMGIKLPIIKEY